MKLIIVRHGETLENSQGVIQGHLPGNLSKTGIDQSKRLAKRLKNEKIDFIYSSDLARAVDTTKEIAKYHSAPVIYTKDLREKFFGEMQGKSSADSKDHSYLSLNCAESTDSIIKRIDDFLHKINPNNSDKTILMVGHGGSIAAVMVNLMDNSFDKILKMGDINNTSVTIFDPVPNLKLFNCTKHLT